MVKIGIICPSEIALRRFMPALQSAKEFEYSGIGIASPEEWFGERLKQTPGTEIQQQQKNEQKKAESFLSSFGGRCYNSYEELLSASEIDAVYIPLPPGLHARWSEIALRKGKHVMVEKPATTSLADTEKLVRLSQERNLALHENYMFLFHSQLNAIEKLIASGEIGEVRLYRINFGFPRRAINDFRYNRGLGGGALLDCGGYTLKYASHLLGKSAKLVAAKLNYSSEFEVDLYGSATMINDAGSTVQIAFGMDNDYRCLLEVWGSKGTLSTNRVFTAPAGFIPTLEIRRNNQVETCELPEDDTFEKSIRYFFDCFGSLEKRLESCRAILQQAEIVEQFQQIAGVQ